MSDLDFSLPIENFDLRNNVSYPGARDPVACKNFVLQCFEPEGLPRTRSRLQLNDVTFIIRVFSGSGYIEFIGANGQSSSIRSANLDRRLKFPLQVGAFVRH